MLVELVRLHLIRLRIILRYRLLLIITIINIIIVVIITNNYSEPKQLTSSNYIKSYSYNEETELYKYQTDDAIIYSQKFFRVGLYIKYSGKCSDTKQRNFVDFNYTKFLISNNIKCSLYNPLIEPTLKSSKYYEIKNNLLKITESTDQMGMKRALILGDSSALSDKNKELFYSLNIGHLLALSGMHIAFITIYFKFIYDKLFKFKEIVTIATVITVSIYALAITLSYSIIRTLGIYYLAMILKLFNIRLSKLTIMLLVVNALILYNPYVIYSYSFIYSFACYFVIIMMMDAKLNFLKLYFTILLFILPITINLNNSINLLGILISPFITIVFELVYYPYIFLTTMFGVRDVVSILFLKVLNIIYSNNFTIIIGDIPIIALTAYYFLCYYFITIKKRYNLNYILTLILIITSCYIPNVRNIEIMVFDVGQGDAILITLDDNKTVLIDSGGSGYSDSKNISHSKYTIIPYLKEAGINKINYVISTHGDMDHSGSMKYLTDNFAIENIFINCNSINELEDSLGGNKLSEYTISGRNYTIDLLCNISDNENDSSIITYGTFFDTTFLAMGDLSHSKEIIYAKKSDILKVSHHGSNSSTSKSVVDIVKPRYSIISVGKNNYGHPTTDVLDNLRESKIYRTDIHGAIRITINNDLVIETKVEE